MFPVNTQLTSVELLSSLVENPQNDFQLAAGVNWEIDLWGRIRRLSEAARATRLGKDSAPDQQVAGALSQVSWSVQPVVDGVAEESEGVLGMAAEGGVNPDECYGA